MVRYTRRFWNLCVFVWPWKLKKQTSTPANCWLYWLNNNNNIQCHGNILYIKHGIIWPIGCTHRRIPTPRGCPLGRLSQAWRDTLTWRCSHAPSRVSLSWSASVGRAASRRVQTAVFRCYWKRWGYRTSECRFPSIGRRIRSAMNVSVYFYCVLFIIRF